MGAARLQALLLITLGCLAVVVPCMAAPGEDRPVADPAFNLSTNAIPVELLELAAIPGSRFPGMSGNLAVQAYVEARFQASGLSNGVMRFDTPFFYPGETSVTLPGGQPIPLQVMHPTMMRPGNFSERDFEAPLVYLGHGRARDLQRVKGADLEGAIALMEFDSGARWLNLYRFGIRGFVFLEPDRYTNFDAKTKLANTEIRLPRFLAPAEVAGELRSTAVENPGVMVRVQAQPSRWENGILLNPWVFIPGADPELGKEVIIMTAAMDAGCIVPERAVGGQYLPNLYLLFKLLDRFKTSPPERSVLLVAVNAHSRNYYGQRVLAHFTLNSDNTMTGYRSQYLMSGLTSARMYLRQYGQLKLRPPSLDAPTLYAALDVLGGLDAIQEKQRTEERDAAMTELETQYEARKGEKTRYKELPPEPPPPIDPALDLSVFSDADCAAALEEVLGAAGARRDAFMPTAPGQTLAEARAEYTAQLASMKDWPPERLKALLDEAIDTFNDEKLLESWRTLMDWSTGTRVPVKDGLQVPITRDVNKLKMEDFHLSTDTTMAPAERDSTLKQIKEELAELTRLLVLFNKIDIGAGRRRVHYREIALDDNLRTVLAGYLERALKGNKRSIRIMGERIAMEDANMAIRSVQGGRHVAFTLALDMNWQGDRVSLNHMSPVHRHNDQRLFGMAVANIAEGLRARDGETPFMDTMTLRHGLRQEHYYHSFYSPAMVMISYEQGSPGFSLRSPLVAEGRSFTPADTLDGLDLRGIERLADWSAGFIAALLADRELTSLHTMKRPRGAFASSPRAFYTPVAMDEYSAKSVKASFTITNCVFAFYQNPHQEKDPVSLTLRDDVINCHMALPDGKGTAFLYGATGWEMVPVVYQADPDYINVTYACDKGIYLTSRQMSSATGASGSKGIVMFPCTEFIIGHRYDPTLISFEAISMMQIWPQGARMRAEPTKIGVTGMGTRSIKSTPHRSTGPTGLYMWRRSKHFKADPIMFVTHERRCVLNASEDEPEGKGFATPAELPRDTLAQAARDMHVMLSHRVNRMKGISNKLVEDFLTRGKQAIRDMAEFRAQKNHSAYAAASSHALGYVVKAHKQTRQITDDMLKAIVIYMALMLPFCVFLQKLLFNTTRLEQELGAFCLLFFGTYVLFRLIHPAFSVATNPEAIFIAFVLGAVGCFIISVLHRRFGAEMQILFRSVTGTETQVGMSTVGQTAMIIGVNNMKRRRIRTSLTTATIVLVVFTMLAFSSVSRKMRPTIIPQSGEAPYTGLFFHWPGGKPMDEATAWALEDLFGTESQVLVRRVMLKERDLLGYPQTWRISPGDKQDTFAEVEAIIGLSGDDEVLTSADPIARGRYFSTDDAHEIMLPLSLAAAIGISSDDVGKTRLRFLGRDLLLVALLDDQRYLDMRDLNPNLPLLPRREEIIEIGSKARSTELEELTTAVEGAVPVNTSGVVVLPVGLSRTLGARPFSISIILDEGRGDVTAAMGSFLTVTDAKFFVAGKKPFKPDVEARKELRAGTYYVGTAYRTSIGGLSRLFIPLLIAGFIILNTMLGTVYERKSEIAVFNAIGLNPTHIFTFFLAEALVYGVIGSVGGYLIGQLLAMGLKAMDLVGGININFSSLMVVYAILFTIGLTLLSTIYPGIVATRTAVPSGQRTWSLPDHDGQRMEVTFPFIYRPELAPGVIHYLQEYFSGFNEESIGDMLASLIRVGEGRDAEGRPCYSLVYDVALAPFDLGVTQVTTFEARYDEVAESYRMTMATDRSSGQDTNWVTVNKPFLEKLRHLLIRWRNIDPTKHHWHVEQGKKLFE